MRTKFISVIALLLGAAVAAAQPSTRIDGSATRHTPTTYDTPQQTQAKLDALFDWELSYTYQNGLSRVPSYLGADPLNQAGLAYKAKAIEILARWRPHRITYEMYEALEDSYMDGKGLVLCSAWLKLGAVPVELSRTSIGDDVLAVYQWRNPDGFANNRLVSKTQVGLRKSLLT
jgi:hypothetical protein